MNSSLRQTNSTVGQNSINLRSGRETSEGTLTRNLGQGASGYKHYDGNMNRNAPKRPGGVDESGRVASDSPGAK